MNRQRVLSKIRVNTDLDNSAVAPVVWLTGLSGAGKSTIASDLARSLEEQGLPVETLDGDSIRALFPNTGFSREERNAHVKRVGYMASLLARHGIFVVVSLISPYREAREFVRGLCPRFVEVYVSTPLEECERRDPKGLYAQAREGRLRHFTGINDPYEPPEAPDLTIDTRWMFAQQAAESILATLGRVTRAQSDLCRL